MSPDLQFKFGVDYKNSWNFIFHPNRDTPHHLKNKRVQQGVIDKAAANILLANTLRQIEPEHVIEESHGISDVNAYQSEQLHENGEWKLIKS